MYDNGEGKSRGIWRIKCIRLWMNQSFCSLGFISQNSLWKLSIFQGYKGIYSRVWEGMWKVIFSKTGCTGESLRTGMSREFQSPDNRVARLYFLSDSDLVVLTLQLSACFTRVMCSGESPLASQLQVASWLRTFDQFFTLFHTHPLHYSHLNIWFLNAEL